MELTTGHLNLFDIYRFVAVHPKFVSGKNGDMGDYTKLINMIVESIPIQPGWYLWGRFNDVGFWETVYLGKAGNKKTSSLKARIREEMLDERAAFWATVYGSEPTERQFQKIYKNKYGPGTRSYRKRNIHFIVWASATPTTEEEIKTEESVLITLYRPAVNIQRVTYPPHTTNTEQVLKAIDGEIRGILTTPKTSKPKSLARQAVVPSMS
jgi:hypothetical protein